MKTEPPLWVRSGPSGETGPTRTVGSWTRRGSPAERRRDPSGSPSAPRSARPRLPWAFRARLCHVALRSSEAGPRGRIARRGQLTWSVRRRCSWRRGVRLCAPRFCATPVASTCSRCVARRKARSNLAPPSASGLRCARRPGERRRPTSRPPPRSIVRGSSRRPVPMLRSIAATPYAASSNAARTQAVAPVRFRRDFADFVAKWFLVTDCSCSVHAASASPSYAALVAWPPTPFVGSGRPRARTGSGAGARRRPKSASASERTTQRARPNGEGELQ